MEYFFYNPIEYVEGNITMIASYNSLLLKKQCLMGTVLKESEVLNSKEVIADKENFQKVAKQSYGNSETSL